MVAANVTHAIAFGIAGDLLLLVGFVMLGADFWDKMRSLFVREEGAVLVHDAA